MSSERAAVANVLFNHLISRPEPDEFPGSGSTTQEVEAEADALADAVLAALEQKEEPGWQPIETAPKDGTEILAAACDGSFAVVYWSIYANPEGWTDGDHSAPWPTHWMPLPEPPGETP